MKKWNRLTVDTGNGNREVITPEIISASRTTDIPAFYSDWFIDKVKSGFVEWINPFNRNQKQCISFQGTSVVVFWTKDAGPIIDKLPELDKRNINYYFSYTVNNYDEECLEINTKPIEQRINTFKRLSDEIGKEKVVWRYDPIIMSEEITTEKILNKIRDVGDLVHEYTEKLVISFADFKSYSKIDLKMEQLGFREPDKNEMNEIARGLQKINKNWGLRIGTCCENVNLSQFNIEHNKCIDDDLMIKLFNNDKRLMNFLEYNGNESLFPEANDVQRSKRLKDKGQREDCGCIMSKDIGQYMACKHNCTYCYANHGKNIPEYERFEYNGYSFLIKLERMKNMDAFTCWTLIYSKNENKPMFKETTIIFAPWDDFKFKGNINKRNAYLRRETECRAKNRLEKLMFKEGNEYIYEISIKGDSNRVDIIK